MEDVRTIFKYTTEFSADSVEFCPHVPFQDRFVCANYYLENNEDAGEGLEAKAQTRLGKIILFRISPGEMTKLKSVDTCGILDQKWCLNKINNCSVLAVANAESTVELYTLSEEGQDLTLLTRFFNGEIRP